MLSWCPSCRPGGRVSAASKPTASNDEICVNDYVLVGPKNDPAKVKEAKTAGADAFKRLASGKADFTSRGDDSGTNKQEKELWEAAGIKPKTNGILKPAKAWVQCCKWLLRGTAIHWLI